MRLGPAPTFRRTLFGLVFLPHGFLLLGMLLVAWFFVEQTNHQTEKQNAKIAQGLALQVWDQLTARVQVLDQLAAVLEVTPSERHQALFERLASQYPVFEGVYLLDPGLLVRGEWPRNQNLVGNDFSGQQVLRRLGALQQVVWSDSFVSPRTGRSTVTLARTYPGGILSANLDLNPLTQLVTQLAKGTEVSVALVDAYGTYLAHPDPKVALRRQPDLKYLSYRETRGPGAFFYTEERQGITDVVSVQPLPETGWAVLVSQPLSSTYLPLAPLLFLLLPMIVLFVLGVGVLVYILDRHLLGALKTLKRQTDSLSQGDFGGGEVRTRYQDLNAILDSYDAMRQSIWQREQDIRLGEKRFRRMFEDAAIGIFYSSYSGEILDLNKTMAELLGYSSPDEVKQAVQDGASRLYVRPEERSAVLKMLQGSTESKVKLSSEFYHRSGRVLTVKLHLARVFDTQRGEFILETFAEDISELKKAEQAIQDLNRALEAKVLERTRHLEKALLDLGTARSHLVHSEKMAALGQLIAGIAHELNTPLGAIHASNDTIATLLQRVLVELPPLMEALTPELRSLQKAFYDAANRNLEVVPSALLRQRRADVLASLASQNFESDGETVDSLVDLGLSDHLDQWLPLLRSSHGPAAVQVTYEMICLEKSCAVIASASEKAAKVINALRTYSHQAQENAFEKVLVSSGLETVLTLFQSRLKSGVVVAAKLDQEARVWGLPDRLNQVWTNLIANALQAMNDKGTLEIRITDTSGVVRISVIDSGPGVPPEIQGRVFEPFFTTKKAGEGSGLGLDICRKIVEEHHGRLDFESRPGRTEFYVELPSAP